MTKKQEQQQAQTELIKILNEINSDTIYTVIRHVSNSGMQREISVKMIDAGRIIHLDWLASTALGMKIGKHNGIVIKGCGMDMGFAIVDNIKRVCNTSKNFRHEWI